MAGAEQWIAQRLAQAETAFRTAPPGPRDLSLEQYEAQLRGIAEAAQRPTALYRGLALDAAQAQAAARGDQLCVHRGSRGHRSDWRAARVHVELDDDDVVVRARRDRAPW